VIVLEHALIREEAGDTPHNRANGRALAVTRCRAD
jgi:hypothetical protein